MLTGSKPEHQRLVAIAVPIVALIVAYFLVVPRYRALKADEEALEKANAAIATKRNSVDVLRNAPKGPPFAHVPATRTEEVEFYAHLSNVARQCRVTMARYTRRAEMPKKATEQKSPPPPIPGLPVEETAPAVPAVQYEGLPPGITPVSVDLQVTGPYAGMALFFGSLEGYDRLVRIDNVRMRASKYPLIQADFRLTRYTSPPPPPTPTG